MNRWPIRRRWLLVEVTPRHTVPVGRPYWTHRAAKRARARAEAACRAVRTGVFITYQVVHRAR